MDQGMPSEIELKLQVLQPVQWEGLKKYLNGLPGVQKAYRRNMAASYYDSSDGLLKQNRIAYRIRREDAELVATVKGGGKAAGGLHQRLEYNVGVKEDKPDLTVFPTEAIEGGIIESIAAGNVLHTILKTEFTRDVVVVEAVGQRIEVAMDQGEIHAAGKSCPILEVELELLEGDTSGLLRLGAQIARRFPVVVENRSKFLRGLQLGGYTMKDTKNFESGIIGQVIDLLDLAYQHLKEDKSDANEKFQRKFQNFCQMHRLNWIESQSDWSHGGQMAVLLEAWAEAVKQLSKKKKIFRHKFLGNSCGRQGISNLYRIIQI